MLSENDKKLILDLATQKIDLDEFYSRYSIKISDDNTYILRMLEEAAQSKDSETIEYLTYLRGYRQDIEPPNVHCEIFRKLLLEDWHKSHEYMVDSLEILLDASAIPALSKRALGTLPKLDDLDNHSLRKRSVYAIAKIGGDSAMQALKKLTESGSDEVQCIARQRLKEMQASN